MNKQTHDSWENLLARTLKNSTTKAAYDEVKMRSYFGRIFSAELKRRNISICAFAKMLNTSKSQVQRLLNENIGGSLTLLTIVKAANALDLKISYRIQSRLVEEGESNE